MTDKRTNEAGKFPPRINITHQPGRLSKLWARVTWASEEFTFDLFRGKDGEEITYLSMAEHAHELATKDEEIKRLNNALQVGVDSLKKIQSGLTTDINKVEFYTKKEATESLIEISYVKKENKCSQSCT